MQQSNDTYGLVRKLHEDLVGLQDDIHGLQAQQQVLSEGLTHANTDLQNLAVSVRGLGIDDDTVHDLRHARALREKSERWQKTMSAVSTAVLIACILSIAGWVGTAAWDRVRIDLKPPPPDQTTVKSK